MEKVEKSKAKVSVQKNRGQRELLQVPISSVSGIHPSVLRMYEEWSVPYMRKTIARLFTREEVNELSSTFPVTITRFKNEIYCSGNINLYNVARIVFSGDDKLYCIVESPRPEDDLKRRALNELLIAPACLGLHRADVPKIVAVARREMVQNMRKKKRSLLKSVLEKEKRNLENRFSKIYLTDVRHLREIMEPDEYAEELKSIVTQLRIYPEE